MNIKSIALTCALLAICLSYLPSSNGQACTAPDTPAGCTDCALEENAASPDCVTTTTAAAATTTVAAGTDTTTTAAGTDTTTTTAAPGTGSGSCGGKKRIKRKFKIVRKPGKKVIKKRRNGNGNKWGLKG